MAARTDLETASVMARGVIAALTLERDEARAERDALRERAEMAERRERVTLRAFEDLLRLGNSERQQQAMAVISVRREREILELQTACCCCGAPKGDDGPDRHGNVWCNDCAFGAQLQFSKTRVLTDPPCPLHAPSESGGDS